MVHRASRATLVALAATLAVAAPADAADPVLLRTQATAGGTVSSCIDGRRSGPAVVSRELTAPRGGYLTARLRGAGKRSDWDLAVYASGNSDPVAASAYRGSREVASGFVERGARLTVQACRLSGPARTVGIRVDLARVKHADARAKLVRVSTPTLRSAIRLHGLGLDVIEASSPAFADVLLHGRRDAAKLRHAGLRFHRVELPKPHRPNVRALLPSGHNSVYRTLAQYSSEMKALAQANPGLVKPFTLAHTSAQGRPLEGIEVTPDVNARDGKPVLLMLGLHHAREWPSGEHTLEYAYDLVNRYKANDARTVSLLSRARVIFVPVVNPDGFNFSRTAGTANGHNSGDSSFNGSNAEYHRKNCRGGTCVVNGGVDLNRNYGDRWGGEGGTDATTSETYRGPSPFSEPEAQDIRELISGRQVTTMITNHTTGDEILRQPGSEDDFPTPDDAIYKQLADDMAAAAGYSSITSYELYAPNDHVGTTDGWSYFTTGGLGFVIESMPTYFHPPFAQVVQHYETGSGNGGTAEGLRESFFLALENTVNTARHSIIKGSAPAGAVLRITKSFQNRTTLGPPTDEHFETTLQVPDSGQFEWHVNQSGRPLFPAEQWTLTCEQPEGTVLATRQVAVARGATATLDLSDCVAKEPPPPVVEPKLGAKLTATYKHRRYRVRVRGKLTDIDPGTGGANCAGKLKIEIFAKSKRVRQRTSTLDATCAYDEHLGFRRRDLPKKQRGKRLRRVRATVLWSGVTPTGAQASAPVVKLK